MGRFGVRSRMIRYCCTALVACLCVISSLGQSSRPSAVSPRYSEAFETIWTDIDHNFFDPSFLGVNWADVKTRYQAQLSEIHDDDGFKVLIDKMLHELPTSHLHFRVATASKTMTPSTRIGVLSREIGGEDVVVSVEPASDAAMKGVRLGDVLLTKEEMLRGPWGSSVEVEVKHCNQKVEKYTLVREPFGWPYERPSVQWKIYRRSAKMKFGYLRIVHFEDDVAPLIDEAMQEMVGTAGIIVDLRDNTGGNASYVRLMSYLSPTPRVAFVLLDRPFLNRFGRAPEKLDNELLAKIPRVTGAYTTEAILEAFKTNGGGAAFYTEDVGKDAHPGKVILLVNHETASAAEGFAWDIKGWPQVTVIGQETSGTIAGAEDFDIPGGWTLTLPTHAAWGPDGSMYRDRTTIPDRVVPETRAMLCSGKDAAMEAATEILLKAESH